MAFHIIRNDITRVKADAIVNTANPKVAVGDGVDAAIYQAAGYERLLAARREIGELRPGQIGMTKAFALDARYIIHVSGPVWEGGSRKEEEILRSCYKQALQLAFEKNCTSIAFPLIATGAYGFPGDLGLQIAIDAFTAFLEEHDMEIILVIFGSEPLFGVAEKTGKKQDRRIRLGSKERIGTEEESLDKILKDMDKESFGGHLQKLIYKKGLKNASVYAAANISRQYFSKLLKDQIKPSKEKVMALAVGLHLNGKETAEFLQLAGYALSPILQTDRIVQFFIEREDYNVIKIDIVLFEHGLAPLSKG